MSPALHHGRRNQFYKIGYYVGRRTNSSNCACPSPSPCRAARSPIPGTPPPRSPLYRVDATQQQQPQVRTGLGPWRQQQVVASDAQPAARGAPLRAARALLGLGAYASVLRTLFRLWWAWGPAKGQIPRASVRASAGSEKDWSWLGSRRHRQDSC